MGKYHVASLELPNVSDYPFCPQEGLIRLMPVTNPATNSPKQDGMKILITGANGFTGQHFAKMAQAAGHEPIGLRADITDPIALEKEILSIAPTAVAHFAGISFVASKDNEAFYRVHALGTSNLLSSLTKLSKPPSKILLASSATVYGNAGDPFSVETQALNPVDHYAMSKVAMEEMAKTYMDRLSIIIVRPFNYTGPGQRDNFLIPKLIKHFAQNLPAIELGNIDVEREFNDVRMICDAYLNLLSHGIPGEIYNVCSGNPRSLKQVLETLIKITRHHINVTVNPEFVRQNEVRRMCGNPAKLNALLQDNHLELIQPSLEETLQSMLLAKK